MWGIFSTLCIALVITNARAQVLSMSSCDSSKSSIIINPTADAFIAGIFGLREPGKAGQGCGTPDPVILPSLEAARFAINRINAQNYIPGVKIGMKVFDTCGRPEIAARDIMQVYPNYYSHSRICQQTSGKLFLGVMGASHSGVSMGVADWLGKLKGAQVSPSSTNSELGDVKKYPAFMRTIPPDSLQAKAILELLKNLNWKFINLVYSNDAYGKDGYSELLRLALDNGICITQAIPVDPTNTDTTVLRTSLERLVASKATAVVYFGSTKIARALMGEANKVQNVGKLQWLFSGSVSGNQYFAASSQYARGYTAVAPGSRFTSEFKNYWLSLNANSNTNNPWHKDWYMTVNKCKFPGVTYSPYSIYPNCPNINPVERSAQYVQNQYVTNTIDAIYTFANALKKARRDLGCGTTVNCLAVSQLTTDAFFNTYLKKVSFSYGTEEGIPSLAGNGAPNNRAHKVSFDSAGELVDSYLEVWNYNNAVGGRWLPRKVGYYYGQKLDMFGKGNMRMYDASRQNALATLPTSLCPAAGCGICLTLQTPTKYLTLLGDVYINAVFSVHDNVNGLTCSKVKAGGAQLSQAFVYAIQNVKKKFPNILQNIRLGGLALDDCSSKALASSVVSNFHSGIITVKGPDGKDITPGNTMAYTAAHDSGITISVAEVLNKIRMPQVGYRSTSTVLSDRSKFPYFLRTVPKDNKQARGIVLSLKQMGWNYVQAVHSPNEYGRDGIREFISQAASEDICVTAKFEFNTHGSYQDIVKRLLAKKVAKVVVVFGEVQDFRGMLQAIKDMKVEGQLLLFGSETWGISKQVIRGLESTAVGSFSVKLYSPVLNDYLNYLRTLQVSTYVENPWFRELYQEAHSCYLSAAYQPFYTKPCTTTQPITGGVNFEQEEYAYYVINAVYAIANGLDKAVIQFCGTGYKTICDNFKNAPNRGDVIRSEIEKTSFVDASRNQFKFIDREGEGNYDIYNYQTTGYVKIGDFKFANDILSLNQNRAQFHSNIPIVSKCAGPTTCRTCLQKLTSKVMHIEGQIMIGAFFPIHYTGGNIYTCGAIKPFNGFQYTEAFAWAIDQVNKGTAPVKLNGVKLGGVGLDDCSSEMQASNLVSTVHSQTLQLSKNGQTINPTTIHAWLTYGSLTSMKVGEMLRQLQIPLVSPSATSVLLKDKVEYSTFYRTVPPDDKQMVGIADLLTKLRVSCVQTVHSGNIYGRTAFTQFRRSAKDKKLCIPACFEIDADGKNANTIMVELAKSTTKVVLVIAEPEHMRMLLAAKKNVSAAGNLRFIGSENWGTLRAIVRDYEAQAENSVTMKVEAPNVPEFRNYLSTLYATKNNRNPWFDEYYQSFYKCDLPSGNKYGKPCSNPSSTPLTTSPNFEQENWVVSTIDAVFAIAQAFSFTLTEVCGSYYTQGKGVCPQFAGDDVNTKILQNLARVNFNWLPQNHRFIFNERAGSMGYDVFRYQQGTNYYKIGRSDGLQTAIQPQHTSTIRYYLSLPTGCSPCDSCKIGSVPQKKEKFTFIPGDVMLGSMFDVHLRDSFPFACSGVKDGIGGFQLIEAFNYAIENINSKRGWTGNILHGVKLGGVGLDSCESAIRAGNLIADFHSGVIKLEQNGQTVDPKKIVAYIGASSTDRSMQVADVLTVLGIPQISYGSSGMQLKNRKKYPFFTRTIPSDDKQMRGIVKFLKKFDINNIQVINSPDPYGISASQELIRIAKENDICIAQNITFQDKGVVTTQSAQDLVNFLLNRPNATVVITILPNDYINLFLQAVKETGIAGKGFRFVASEGWGNDPKVIKGAEGLLEGTVTFNLESADVKGFKEYLSTKFPNSYTRNPWFAEYYEKVYQCTLPGNILQYPTPCPKTSESVVADAAKYQQDPLVMYVINAVYSAAIGIDYAIKQLCGRNQTGLCDKWRASQNKNMIVLEGIKQKASFIDATGQKFFFVGNGESIRGFDIYSLKKLSFQGNILAYTRIGKYVDNYKDISSLKIDPPSYKFKVHSNCSFIESCNMCPYIARKRSVYMQVPSDRDINMVAFFDVHQPGSTYMNCGKLNTNGGFQQMLAFFYALEMINAGKIIPSNNRIRIGGLAIDTCSNLNRMRISLKSYISMNGLCYYATYKDLLKPNTVVDYLVQGNDYSIAASKILTPKTLTSISPMASSTALSDKKTHPFFLRTVPPCNIQANAIIDIMKEFRYARYFFAVYSDDECGRANIDALLAIVTASNGSYCMGKRFMVPKDATELAAASIMTTLAYSYPKESRALVLFTTSSDTRLLLQAAHRQSLIDRFTIIAGRGWCLKSSVHKDYERVARGAITLSIRNYGVPGFIEWVANMNMTNKYKLPNDWFHQFWQEIHKCHIPGSPVIAFQYPTQCVNTMRTTASMLNENPDVLQTIIATYITAKGMSDLYANGKCTLGACLNYKNETLRRQDIFNAIRSSNLAVLPDDIKKDFQFLFRSGHYGNTGYFVNNLQKVGDKYEFAQLGKWSSGTLNIKSDLYKVYKVTGLPYDNSDRPNSTCPENDRRCDCEKVSQQAVNATLAPPPDKTAPFASPAGITIAVFNVIGALTCFVLFFHFMCFYPDKGGTQSLGYFCLFSIFLLFVFNFSYIVHACAITCGVRRFCQGLIYAMIFAPMCVKVMNTWRIAGLMKDDFVVDSRRRFTHPCGLMTIAICFILVQVIVATEWLIIEPPGMEYINFQGQKWPRCSPEWFYNQGLVLSCLYVIFLMCLTTFFAGICWPVKENNHEARWIMGGSAFVMGSWLVWCIVSTMTDMPHRDGATAIGNLFSGFGLLGFVFFRKCHLLQRYRREAKNKKEGKEGSLEGIDYPDNKDSEKQSVHSTRDSRSGHH